MGTREAETIGAAAGRARTPTDVVIVVALEDELDALIEEGGGAAAWREDRDRDGMAYRVATIAGREGKPLTVAAAWTGAMGTTATATRASALISDLRPSCVAMCGICAGKRGEVSLGDVIVADRLYSFDHGKLVASGDDVQSAFYHDLETYNLERSWRMDAAASRRDLGWAAHLLPRRPRNKDVQRRWLMHAIRAHTAGSGPPPVEHPDRAAMFRIDGAASTSSDWVTCIRELSQQSLVDLFAGSLTLTERGRRCVDDERLLYAEGLPRELPFQVHIGPIATGNAVIEDPEIFQRLKRVQRKTLGVEMEAFAIGYLGETLPRRAIVVKAVSDHADHDKDDRFREFACHASAAWLLAFLGRQLAPQRTRAPIADGPDDGPRSPFPDLGADRDRSEVHGRPDNDRESSDAALTSIRSVMRGAVGDDDLYRVNELYRRVQRAVGLRVPGTTTAWKRGPEEAPAPVRAFLEVRPPGGGYTRAYPVAVIDGALDRLLVDGFFEHIVARYRADTPYVEAALVHTSVVAPEVVDEARWRGVRLESLLEVQGLLDFRPYVAEQTRTLERDVVYPSDLYVAQRLSYGIGRDERSAENALDTIERWLGEDGPQLLLVLGDFGTGKTFLMHELALRLGRRDSATVPILVELRKLEKAQSLDALLGQHFIPERGMNRFDYDAFRYMLEEGRIALLFDGFDELALRVTYETATEHLDTVLQAAVGRAKVVITSRTQHFINDQQVVRALGERVTQRGFRMARLMPFDEPRIRQFLVNRFDDDAVATAWFELLGDVKDLLGLSHNPRMLSFIAEIPEQDLRRAAQGGEITAATLYRVLLEKWLGHEVRRDHPAGIEPGLSASSRWRAVTALAHILWPRKARAIAVSEIPTAILDEVAQLTERAPGPDAVAHKVGSGTLLTRDEDGRFSFIHQSIIEWFVANSATDDVRAGRDCELLAGGEMSDLMADFLTALAGRDAVLAWARRVMSAPSGEVLAANANRLLRRLQATNRAGTAPTAKEALDAALEMPGHDLRGQDFSGTSYLRGASLEGSNLSETSLVRADLSSASLVRAQLQRANLEGANLRGADLRNADLSFARLLGADLTGAKLEGAILRYAKLVGATVDANALDGVDCFGAAVPHPKGFDLAFGLPAATCTSIAWSPDGALLALGYRDGAVVLADAANGRSLRQLESHPYGVTKVAFSPKSAMLASASDDHSVRLWDLQSGALLQALEGHTGRVSSIAFFPDGQLLASASHDGTVVLWNVDSGAQAGTLDSSGRPGINCIAFAPQGGLLALGSQQMLDVWDLGQRRLIASIRHSRITAIAFSPESTLLAVGTHGGAVVWWRPGATVLLEWPSKHSGPVTSLAFSPTTKLLASGSDDGQICFWNPEIGSFIRRIEAHPARVTSIAFSPDGKQLAAAYDDQVILIWSPDTGKQARRLKRGSDWVNAVAFSPRGALLASASRDRMVRLWDLSTGALQRIATNHSAWVNSVAFSPDGGLLASASNDRTIIVADTTGKESVVLEGHSDCVNSIAFSPDSQLLASGSNDSVVRLWHVPLSSGRSETAVGTRAPSHRRTSAAHLLSGHTARVNSVDFSPDGVLLASGSDDATVRIWDVESRTAVRSHRGHAAWVHCVAFSPVGGLLASGSEDRTIQVWDTRPGVPHARFDGHTAGVSCIAFSKDGKLLASGSFKTVKLWDIVSGKLLSSFEAHTHWINGIAFSADGALLATGSSDCTIRLWSVASARRSDSSDRCLATVIPARDGWMTIAPDGRYKRGGEAESLLGFSVGLCRFAPGELDDYPDTFAHPRRIPDDEPLFALERSGARRSV